MIRSWFYCCLLFLPIESTSGTFYKLYLHTDREYYLPGDTLWFSPYVVKASSHQPLAEEANLQAELINKEGTIVISKKFILENGICSGWMVLDREPGTYTLRAYTDPMRLWDEGVFFRKTIHIGTHSRKEHVREVPVKPGKAKTVTLYPEGGFLLNERPGEVAFVAYDKQGRRTDLDAFLTDNGGMRIPLKSLWQGSGRFLFTPQQGKDYRIVSAQGETVRFQLPDIRSEGARLRLLQANKTYVSFSADVSANMEQEDLYVVIYHRGEAAGYVKIPTYGQERNVSFSTEHLGLGINRIVLANQVFEPLSERLVFIDKQTELQPININLESKDYTKRERVELQLGMLQAENPQEWARVSVSIVNDNLTGFGGNNLDIRSWLLLDSELKGRVPYPGSYFVDDSVSSAQKIDLLMLTNGWRNYVWQGTSAATQTENHDYKPGYTFAGKVSRNIIGKPFRGARVHLNIAGYELLTATTDKDGLFVFDSVAFFGPSLLFLLATDEKGRSSKTTPQLYPFERKPAPVSKEWYVNPDDMGVLSYRWKRLTYPAESQTFEMYLEEDARLLKEIFIVAQQPEKADPHVHKRIYAKPAQSLKVAQRETHYRNVFEFMEGRFPGVMVIENTVIIRGGSSLFSSNNAILMLDGMIVEPEVLEAIPMHDIDVVEVIKGPEAAIFGVRGANGVVSVFTRTGAYDVEPKEVPGLIVQKIEGFEYTRTFYSPDYQEQQGVLSSETALVPDHRKTLYWNPLVLLDQTAAPLSFYTGDQLAHYFIFVEGVTSEGRICTGTTDFTVSY